MDTARNNVTQISQFSRDRRNSGGGRTPLDDCREMSALGLKNALGESLEQVKLQLLPMVEKTMGAEMYHLYMDALDLLRDRRDEIETAFSKDFLQRFNRECRREAGRVRKDSNALELSLMAPDDLEESLASGNLANAIHNACVEELFGLDKRIGMLINDPDLQYGDNPLGPEVIAAALMSALESMDVPMKSRLLVVTQLNKHLPERVKNVYRDINQQLVNKNVLPTIRVGLRRSAQTASSEGQASAAAPGGEVKSGDLFALLQQLMGLGAGVAAMPVAPIPGPPMPGEPAGLGRQAAAAVQPGTFIYTLSQLQRGQMEAAAQAGLDAAIFGNGQINVLRNLRNSDMASAMSSLDAMTLDIVAMVFDYILDDKRIPDAIKALIGRLQIPVLKVAMLDKAFFSQKNHPARKLLDVLAEAAIGWDADEGHDSGLYRKIEELVENILERFEDRIELFSEALDELKAFLAVERRTAARAVVTSVQAIKAREQADIGRLVAHDEVQSALVGNLVPAVINGFLTEHWQYMLADIHQKVGSESPTWKGAVETMSDLIWSVAPKTNADERKRLVGMLPGLLKRLDEGITYLGMTKEERDGFFASLVKCHAEAVKAGLLDEGEVIPPMAVAMPEDTDIPVLTESTEFEPVKPVAEAVTEAPELVEELVAGEDITIAEFGWDTGDLDIPLDAETELNRLKRGSWIEYAQEDGSNVRAKLSWVSPLKGIYLFTNRLGQRAISISAEGLLSKLNSGEARVLNDVPLMDRAVDSLMERLQRNAA
ncbi:MAG TPA: DUF1631 domain-containing protein [Parasulfuritortus sp.]